MTDLGIVYNLKPSYKFHKQYLDNKTADFQLL